MSLTVGVFLRQRVRGRGVEHVFGYPGHGINGLRAAYARADDQPEFAQTRPEEMAAFEACGYAEFGGKVGACTATSGPGAVHLLNGLYDAKSDHVPVVAIVGQTERSAMGGSDQPEVDRISWYEDVAGLGLQAITADKPGDVGTAWDAAPAAVRPTLLDIFCDPDGPPIPPPATLQQARNTAETLYQGDEDRVGIVEEGFKEKRVGLLPGRRGSA